MRHRAYVAVWSCALALTACDMKIVDPDGPALIDPTPGPAQGSVSDDPGKADWSRSPTTGERLDGLEHLNDVRARLGLDALGVDPQLTAASRLHAAFLAANWDVYDAEGLSPHRQEEELAGFTGVSSLDRARAAGYEGQLRSEVIAFKATSAAAVEAWLDTLYHRLPLIRPGIAHIGYGEAASDGDLTVNVALVGRPPAGAWEPNSAPDTFVVYPADGAEDVPFAWSGREIPQPPAPPAGYPSGPVVSLSAVFGEVALESAEIAASGGRPLPATVLTQGNDANLGPVDVAIIPHAPLSPHTAYVVTMRGRLSGSPFERSWTFTTRAETCSPTADSCGAGLGCYPQSGQLVCQFEGAGAEGEACRAHGDCEPGLGCLGATCRPLCALGELTDPNAWRCDELCPTSTVEVGDYAGLCAPPGGCNGASCGEGQGCYFATSGLMCAWAGEVERGGDCTFANDCLDGLTCLSSGGAAPTCHAMCGGDGMPECVDVCKDSNVVTVDADQDVQACR